MEIRLDGTTALVCGSTQGIGLATARLFASLGARVIMLARDEEKLLKAKAELTPHAKGHLHLVADMSDTLALSSVAGGIEIPVDVLVNNTGGPPPGPAHEAGIDEFERAFRLHLLAYQTMVRALVPGMKQRRRGRIINVISTSVKQPLPNLGVSNTIRGAVASWSKTLATELGPYGITVNNVLPGATSTERLEAIISNKAHKSGSDRDEVAREMMQEIPLRRFAQPHEIAGAIAFLAGPSGAYINGINLPVDGGRTACL
jgi:3-oxoacyl-[acyl-carrier protein] reductase